LNLLEKNMSSTQPIDLRRDRTPLARASPLIVAATDFTPAALAAARRAAELAPTSWSSFPADPGSRALLQEA
jgi:hypothetical protein